MQSPSQPFSYPIGLSIGPKTNTRSVCLPKEPIEDEKRVGIVAWYCCSDRPSTAGL